MEAKIFHIRSELLGNALKFKKYTEHEYCYICGEGSSDAECINCPKLFHFHCWQQGLNSNLCGSCYLKANAVCGECKTDLNCAGSNVCENKQQINKELQTQYQQVTKPMQDNIKICTLCTTIYHRECMRRSQFQISSSFSFFNLGYNMICSRCLFTKGITNIFDAKMPNNQLQLLVNVKSQSPIHRTWISQPEFAALRNRIYPRNKILAAKMPVVWQGKGMSDIIKRLQQLVENRSELRFGSLSNIWFLVKWENEGSAMLSWQDQTVVAIFESLLRKFIILLRYQQAKFKIPLCHLSELPTDIQHLTLQWPYDQIINKISARHRQKQVQLLQFNPETNHKLIQQILILILYRTNKGQNPYIIVTSDEQIYQFYQLFQAYLPAYTVIILNQNACTQLTQFQLQFSKNSYPKYDILIMSYTFSHNLSNFSHFAKATHIILHQFKTNNECITFLQSINIKQKVVVTTDIDDSNNKITQQIIGKRFKNKMMFNIYHIDSLIAEIITEKDKYNCQDELYQKSFISNHQINRNCSFSIGRLQRMIFNDFILSNGCAFLLYKSLRIPEQLTKFCPQYQQIIQQYDADCYLQYLQLYFSTLKDFQINGQLNDEQASQMYFGIDASQIYKIICQKQRQQKKINLI